MPKGDTVSLTLLALSKHLAERRPQGVPPSGLRSKKVSGRKEEGYGRACSQAFAGVPLRLLRPGHFLCGFWLFAGG